MTREMCDVCKRFDEMMNGGENSLDVYVECNHLPEEIIGHYDKILTTTQVPEIDEKTAKVKWKTWPGASK